MAGQSSNAANATVILSQKLNKMIAGGSQDYYSWRSLILEIETASPEDIDTISLAYDSFLSLFRLCHWHLEKYAYHKARLCGTQEAVKIFERGSEMAMFSVGFWVDYFTFGASCFGDPEDVRRLFGKAISFVGKDYFCHVLWDKYMKYEFSQEGWSFLAQSYIQALRFPTKKLHFYYDNFKQFVANLEEEMEYEKNNSTEVDEVSVPCAAAEISRDEISLVIKDLLDSSDRSLKSKALDRYRSIGEEFYQEACQVDEKVKYFETKIQRRYFHVTPLGDDEISNWHLYLDFIEKQDNLDSAVKLYERCLIPCANYPEFWMRYVEFVESKGGRELAVSALDRSTQIFLKNAPDIHLFSARFKEHIGDVDGARAALLLCDTKNDSSFIENISSLANLERRLGNFAVASGTYEKAIKTAREKRRLLVLPKLYSHFAGLTLLITGRTAAARDILIEGIRQVPCSRFLLEELIRFVMTREGASQVNIVDSVIADAISPGSHEYEGLNAKDREDISCLYLEFVNLCGTTHDIRKAWNRHIKLFPQFLRNQTTSKSTTGNQLFGHDIQLQGQEQVLDFPVNHEIHPNQVLRKPSPLKDHKENAKELPQAVSCKDVASSNEDAEPHHEPACELSCQSKEDKAEPMDVSAELADRSKENALSTHESLHELSSRGDKPGQMEFSAALAKQSKENALSPHESAHEVGKSSEATDSDEMSRSSLIYVQPVPNHEFKPQKHPASSDNVRPNSEKKESQELIPMSCDENETKKSVSISSEIPPGPKSVQIVEFQQVHNELERAGSMTRKHNMEEPSSTGVDSIEVDHVVPAPRRKASGSQEHTQDQEHHPANILDSKPINPDSAKQRQKLSQAELGAVQEDKARDQDWPTSVMTPPNSMSAGQTQASSQPVSYPQQNMNQMTSPSAQYQWQTQQSLDMNQMLQYHFHQQQLLQQQYQQQLQMQHSYFQCMNQQPYQLQPQQQNQQQMQLVQQQHYLQQQQLQSQSYQLQQLIQQSQQQLQQQNTQSQQGQDSQQNFQQSHEKQYHQPQDPAYQAHQLAYQNVSLAQQLLLQQYQQYQGYQHMQNQQQSQEGPHHMQGQQAQKQQNEILQQYHQQLISNQNLTQNQQGSKGAPPDSTDGTEPSESPHRQVKSPDVLQ
ncbi:mRNA processing protein [Handroanthus impetiginosus]|uniref:mRNA processing protein n=1 Tax=Handroanthus impetiginosus TaxID=429701 RepID=A0A2G9G7R8_9LAMI|nr:mRNA processing protein [Handroanthus impetiginosus]